MTNLIDQSLIDRGLELCPSCDYKLIGLGRSSGCCPECGWEYDEDAAAICVELSNSKTTLLFIVGTLLFYAATQIGPLTQLDLTEPFDALLILSMLLMLVLYTYIIYIQFQIIRGDRVGVAFNHECILARGPNWKRFIPIDWTDESDLKPVRITLSRLMPTKYLPHPQRSFKQAVWELFESQLELRRS